MSAHVKIEGLENRTLFSAAPLLDINPHAQGALPAQFVQLNGYVYFVANDGTHGAELWRSGGTSGSTSLVKDIVPGSGGSEIQGLTSFDGKLFSLPAMRRMFERNG